MPIHVQTHERVTTVIIDRPARRNAIDAETAADLATAFHTFDADPSADVAVLTGAEGVFCAGADLTAIAAGRPNRVALDGDGPLGPTRIRLSKPVIAAIEGWAVAGGLELAIWCDLRVAADTARFGVLCRRVGVPLVDGGTWRLPRLIGLGRAMDLVLTGREVDAAEALAIGLVNRLTPHGGALSEALALARSLTHHPQAALRSDRAAMLDGLALDEAAALRHETQLGLAVLDDAAVGARRFTDGEGRRGGRISRG
jgi:enoyl-CoA hydratase